MYVEPETGRTIFGFWNEDEQKWELDFPGLVNIKLLVLSARKREELGPQSKVKIDDSCVDMDELTDEVNNTDWSEINEDIKIAIGELEARAKDLINAEKEQETSSVSDSEQSDRLSQSHGEDEAYDKLSNFALFGHWDYQNMQWVFTKEQRIALDVLYETAVQHIDEDPESLGLFVESKDNFTAQEIADIEAEIKANMEDEDQHKLDIANLEIDYRVKQLMETHKRCHDHSLKQDFTADELIKISSTLKEQGLKHSALQELRNALRKAIDTRIKNIINPKLPIIKQEAEKTYQRLMGIVA